MAEKRLNANPEITTIADSDTFVVSNITGDFVIRKDNFSNQMFNEIIDSTDLTITSSTLLTWQELQYLNEIYINTTAGAIDITIDLSGAPNVFHKTNWIKSLDSNIANFIFLNNELFAKNIGFYAKNFFRLIHSGEGFSSILYSSNFFIEERRGTGSDTMLGDIKYDFRDSLDGFIKADGLTTLDLTNPRYDRLLYLTSSTPTLPPFLNGSESSAQVLNLNDYFLRTSFNRLPYSLQNDAFQNFTGSITASSFSSGSGVGHFIAPTGVINTIGANQTAVGRFTSIDSGFNRFDKFTIDPNTDPSVRTATETRPKNFSMYAYFAV